MEELIESSAPPGSEEYPAWLLEWFEVGEELRAMVLESSHDDRTLRAVALLRAVRSRLDEIESSLISASRDRGKSWRRIAMALGVGTPQAAQQYYLRVSQRVRRARGRDVPCRSTPR